MSRLCHSAPRRGYWFVSSNVRPLHVTVLCRSGTVCDVQNRSRNNDLRDTVCGAAMALSGTLIVVDSGQFACVDSVSDYISVRFSVCLSVSPPLSRWSATTDDSISLFADDATNSMCARRQQHANRPVVHPVHRTVCCCGSVKSCPTYRTSLVTAIIAFTVAIQ